MPGWMAWNPGQHRRSDNRCNLARDRRQHLAEDQCQLADDRRHLAHDLAERREQIPDRLLPGGRLGERPELLGEAAERGQQPCTLRLADLEHVKQPDAQVPESNPQVLDGLESGGKELLELPGFPGAGDELLEPGREALHAGADARQER
jgi:hypothetical protein